MCHYNLTRFLFIQWLKKKPICHIWNLKEEFQKKLCPSVTRSVFATGDLNYTRVPQFSCTQQNSSRRIIRGRTLKTSILKRGGVYNRIKILKSFVLFTKIQFFFLFFSHHTRSHALRKQLSYLSLIQCSTPQFYPTRLPRLDYQPLFGKMSTHSSPIFLRGGSKTGPGRRRQSSQEISTHSLLYDPDKRQETFRGALSILLF